MISESRPKYLGIAFPLVAAMGLFLLFVLTAT